ncbi:MAG: hypothetical protein WC169_12490 [Dehalococcoidia bacterium]|jgi:hypothetical protein
MKIFKEDIQALADLYIKLKEIMVILMDLETKYSSIKPFKEHIHKTIGLADILDHQIKQEAWDLAMENKKEQK